MATQTIPRPRGRPRAYDPEQALERAMHTFWKRGYCGTTLDDLSAAMHMNRPSLYAGFGDKHQLYLKAMQRFQAQARKHFAEALAPRVNDCSFADVIARYLYAAIDLYTGKETTGCAVIATATAHALTEPDIGQVLDTVLQEMDSQLCQCLQSAMECGALPRDADIEALTFLLASTTHSIGIRARAGFTRQRLERMAGLLVRTLWPLVGKTPVRHTS